MKVGLITASIVLSNPMRPESTSLEVKCLADTGALYLCIPEHVAIQLGYDPKSASRKKEITTADGARHLCPYVGPVQVSFKNRTAFVGAMVLGEEVLLGAIPMEDLDVVIVPSTLTIDVNPDAPNYASGRVKIAV